MTGDQHHARYLIRSYLSDILKNAGYSFWFNHPIQTIQGPYHPKTHTYDHHDGLGVLVDSYVIYVPPAEHARRVIWTYRYNGSIEIQNNGLEPLKQINIADPNADQILIESIKPPDSPQTKTQWRKLKKHSVK